MAKYVFNPNTAVKPTTAEPDCCEFIDKLFSIRDTAHRIHLEQKIRSYAVHVAMQELYEGILDIADDIAECYQGLYGLTSFDFGAEPYSDALSYVQSCYDYVAANRYIFQESFFQNEIDNVAKLLAKTLYRLKFVTSAPA